MGIRIGFFELSPGFSSPDVADHPGRYLRTKVVRSLTVSQSECAQVQNGLSCSLVNLGVLGLHPVRSRLASLDSVAVRIVMGCKAIRIANVWQFASVDTSCRKLVECQTECVTQSFAHSLRCDA